MALLVLTAMAAEGGKAEKQGEACKAQDGFFNNKNKKKETIKMNLQVLIAFMLYISMKQECHAVQYEIKSILNY